MARRRNKKEHFLMKLGKGATKLGGGVAVGAVCGATEELLGKDAALITRGVMAATGLGIEVLVDQKAGLVREAGKALLYGASALGASALWRVPCPWDLIGCCSLVWKYMTEGSSVLFYQRISF